MKNFKSKAAAFFRGESFMGTSITALLIGVVIAINAIIYAITNAFGLYLYVPESYDMSVSGMTDVLFEDVKDIETVKVIFCREKTLLDTGSIDEVVAFYETAKEFAERYGSFVEIECVNLITKRNQDGELVDLSQYQIEQEDGTPYPMYESSVVFVSRYGHKVISDIASATCVYDTSDSSSDSYGQLTAYNGEEVLASMLLWVLETEHPKAYFTTFHGEVADVSFANMLSCAGYEIDTIDLRSVDMIPEDAGMIVISNPVKDFERAIDKSGVYSEIEKLRAYLDGGGSLYVAIDPYVEQLDVLEEFLAEYGIGISETERDGKSLRNIVRDNDNAVTADSFTLIAEIPEGTELGGAITEKLSSYGSTGVLVRECAALVCSGNAEPMLVASPASEIYAGGERVGSDGGYCLAAMSVNENDNGTESRVFVISSIYLTASNMIVGTGYANRNFIYSVFEYTYGLSGLPYGCKTTVFRNNGMLENLTMGTARIYTAIIMAVPAAIALTGAIIIIKRKNR